MAKAVTIRNVPDSVAAELATRAAASGRSLQEYLLVKLCDLASRPDPSTWTSSVRRRVSAAGSVIPADEILAWRDSDRR